jgi:Fe2+ or Zn2+ uptake regulation protein
MPPPARPVAHSVAQSPDVPALLREAGLRVTTPRVAVYDAVRLHPHADAETVTAAVRAAVGSVSTQAVYDVLHALTARGLLRRIEPAGSPARYETRVGDNHHHVVCRSCGATADVDCAVGAAPCLEASSTSGFVLDEAEVVFWGLCPQCSSGLPGTPDRTPSQPYPDPVPDTTEEPT